MALSRTAVRVLAVAVVAATAYAQIRAFARRHTSQGRMIRTSAELTHPFLALPFPPAACRAKLAIPQELIGSGNVGACQESDLCGALVMPSPLATSPPLPLGPPHTH
jgi:hypothetical protein